MDNALEQGLSLAIVSPKDAVWQPKKLANTQIVALLIGTIHETLALKMKECSVFLAFQRQGHTVTGEVRLKLKSVHTCKVRIDPVCSWAKSRVWQKRLNDGFSRLFDAYPTARPILLTLTGRSCHISDLRANLDARAKAFARLLDNRELKKHILGYSRTMEVTRLFDWYDRNGNFLGRHGTTWFKRHESKTKNTWKAIPTQECNPHYHVLLIMKPSYFSRGYLSQSAWCELWQKSQRIDYIPVVDVRAIKPKSGDRNDINGILGAVKETAKYCVKHSDVTYDQAYLVEIITQLHATKHIVLGGVVKKFVNYKEPNEDEILNAVNDDLDDTEWIDIDMVYFHWNDQNKKDYISFNR